MGVDGEFKLGEVVSLRMPLVDGFGVVKTSDMAMMAAG